MVKKTIKIVASVTVRGTEKEVSGAKKFIRKEVASDISDQLINLPENVNVVDVNNIKVRVI